MPDHISQVNASRGGLGPIRDAQQSDRRPVVSEADRIRTATDKPRYRAFNSENEERRRSWEENRTAEFKRDLENERERGTTKSKGELESIQTDVHLETLKRSAISHAKVAMAVANTNHQAAAAALHKGNAATTWAVNLIANLNKLKKAEEVDPDAGAVIDHCKGMVRRVACGVMMDWESAALGMDVDPMEVGGQA